MTPRYRVGSVTGYSISGDTTPTWSAPSSRRKPSTLWYVLDSAYCFRVVAETRFNEAKAREIAARLNRADMPEAKPERTPKSKLKRKRKARPKKRQTEVGAWTEYMGYVLYVIPHWIFVYDKDKNLRATVTQMPAARAAVRRLRREARSS